MQLLDFLLFVRALRDLTSGVISLGHLVLERMWHIPECPEQANCQNFIELITLADDHFVTCIWLLFNLLIPIELMLGYSKDCTESCENFFFHMTVISTKPQSIPKYKS